MSKTTFCRRCGGTIIEPAYPGDGVYDNGTCDCDQQQETQQEETAR